MAGTRQLFARFSLDFELLRRQKAWLLRQTGDAAEGLLGLIDAIQDQAVVGGVATEDEVFGSNDDPSTV